MKTKPYGMIFQDCRRRAKFDPPLPPNIACGRVMVNRGDFVIADTIEVAVVPIQRAEDVRQLAKDRPSASQTAAAITRIHHVSLPASYSNTPQALARERPRPL